MLWLSVPARTQGVRMRGTGVRDDRRAERLHDAADAAVRVWASDAGPSRRLGGEDSQH